MIQNCEVCGAKKTRGTSLMLRMYEGVVVATCRKCEDMLDEKTPKEKISLIQKLKNKQQQEVRNSVFRNHD